MTDALQAAIASNIHLCQSILAQFGVTRQAHPTYVTFNGPKRKFYPSLITTMPAIDDTALSKMASLPMGAGVKDSFSSLDLEPMGFKRVLQANWIARKGHDPSRSPLAHVTSNTLMKWRHAWGPEPDGQSNFTKTLFDAGDIHLLSTPDFASGGITNHHTADVTGLSNLFGPPDRVLGGLHHVPKDNLIVGYESEPAPFIDLGFDIIGPLSVWIKVS